MSGEAERTDTGASGTLPSGVHFSEALVALFLLGAVAFDPLILDVFDPPPDLLSEGAGPAMVLGMPLLFVYIFTVWAILIGLIALAVERSSRSLPAGEVSPPGSDIE